MSWMTGVLLLEIVQKALLHMSKNVSNNCYETDALIDMFSLYVL